MERRTAATPSGPDFYPTTLVVLRALVVARWLALGWMIGIVLFDTDLIRPSLAWAAVGATLALTATSTALLRTEPKRLLQPWFVVTEVGLALGLSTVDGHVFAEGHVFGTTQSLATQWPLLAMATAGVALGPLVAAALGVLVGPAEWLGAILNGIEAFDTRQLVSIGATSIFFAACGGVIGWLARRLRLVEAEIADRRARDEVARVLHDTVLQTLALTERRTADSDPALAAAARQADQDLRAFLFGSNGRMATDLRGRIRAQVDRVRSGYDTPVTVSVIDTGCRLDDRSQELFARAIGEAVANALQHAAASRIVVFAETDDDGHLFASVDDDGVGFDPTTERSSQGIDESIIARIRSIGGQVEITSSAESGTEVCLRSHTA